jgi:6-pyruvoyltetrahydropterin/6-carboxytetrahydropterin synthase
MMELTTYTELEIAHRLMTSYAQKCRSLHGHRYEVEITVTAKQFNEDGMIVDFKKLKEVVKTVLDDKWDHGSCFNANDPLAKAVDASGSARVHIINANPTLEWMVEHWALELQKALDSVCPGVAVSMLKASETARNTVTWRCNCLPWERSESVNDAKKPVCADKEKVKERVDAGLRPAPKKDWASPGATVKVDTSLPTDEMEEGITGVEEEPWSPDDVPYLVAYRDCLGMYSAVVYSSLTGKELVEYCQAAVTKVGDPCGTAVVLGISRLPG